MKSVKTTKIIKSEKSIKEKQPVKKISENKASVMTMLFIVYSNAVDEEMVDLAKEFSNGYTKFCGVQGEGNGDPHLGDHIWPSMNNSMMVAIDKENETKLTTQLKVLEEKFTGIGIKAFSVGLNNIY